VSYYLLNLLEVTEKIKGHFVKIAALQTENLVVDFTVYWAQSTTMID